MRANNLVAWFFVVRGIAPRGFVAFILTFPLFLPLSFKIAHAAEPQAAEVQVAEAPAGETQAAETQANKQRAHELFNQANAKLHVNDFAGAIPLLQQAIQIDDSFAAAHANLGWSLAKVGQLTEGKSEMERATVLNPKLAPPWSNLAPIYVNAGNLPAAANAYEKYLALTPPSPSRKPYEEALMFIKKQIAEGSDPKGPDYFKAAMKPQLCVWNQKHMPIKVYIAPAAGVEGYKPVYDEFLRQAFSDWADASAGRISFTFVPTRENADIDCEWTHDASRVKFAAEGGQCLWKGFVTGGLQHADILLLTVDPPKEKLTDAMIGWVTHHEIGHALGIHGHSGNAQDIMFFAGNNYAANTKLSERDKNTLTKLYAAGQ
jgi:predicted Zn-dependent protease